MARILVVDGGTPAMRSLARWLAAAGEDVAQAPTALFALTALEWTPPDLILCSATLPDMSGEEFCAIVRGDPQTNAIPFVLVGAPAAPGAERVARAGADLILADASGLSVLRGGLPALLRDTADSSTSRRARDQIGERPLRGFAGSLEVLDVATVIQAVAHTNMTGRLSVMLDAGDGLVVFDRGRPIHAEFGGEHGEPAIVGLLTFRARGGSFAFAPLEDGGAAGEPRTIDATAEKLLLTAAAHIDERCAGIDEDDLAIAGKA
jgi:CheY-like chemotaxis protein